jgi:hypothetical protein
MNIEIERCVICTAPIQGVFELNNPWPVKDEGHCCGFCNASEVVPERIALYLEREKTEVET